MSGQGTSEACLCWRWLQHINAQYERLLCLTSRSISGSSRSLRLECINRCNPAPSGSMKLENLLVRSDVPSNSGGYHRSAE